MNLDCTAITWKDHQIQIRRNVIIEDLSSAKRQQTSHVSLYRAHLSMSSAAQLKLIIFSGISGPILGNTFMQF